MKILYFFLFLLIYENFLFVRRFLYAKFQLLLCHIMASTLVIPFLAQYVPKYQSMKKLERIKNDSYP